MKDFCIIGSGISGSTIAHILSKKYSLDLFDKARGAGGRASNKKFNKNESFDHGAQYISPKNNQFKKFINTLIVKKIVKKWTGKHVFLNANKQEEKNHIKIIGNKGNNSISKYLLKDINCTFNSELIKISHKDKVWELDFSDGSKKFYKSLILTCPFPQLKKLSKKYIKHSFIKQKVKMDANITVMLATKKTRPSISSYFFSDRILGWAAYENSKKRFKSDYDLWTLQSTYKWANKVINKNKINKLNNAKILINKFFEITNLKKK
jgi:renalase